MNGRTDVLIVGGGTGGCAAALAAARCGLDVVLVEETSWIGGQFTSQGVPPDEHGWIERFGCTASYRRLRQEIRDYYRRYYPLTSAARAFACLNPGNGWVSPLCHEPKVSHALLRAMMAPFVSAGRLRILDRSLCRNLVVSGDWIRGAVIESEGTSMAIEARWFLDATDLSDLLPMAGAEFVTGADSRRETGEPGAPLDAQPENVQAFSWCFAMEHFAGEDHRIVRPARYEYWRDYVPSLTPPWPGRLLDWTTPNPRTMQPNHYRFDPHAEQARAFSGLWSYRRLLDRSLFTRGFFPSDRCLVNWPLIDYLDGELSTASEQDRGRFLAEAREMSLCVFYWLQNDAPRPDGGVGWPGLKLCGDALGTTDGFAMAPYIRESRRIRARRTIVEQDVSAACRTTAEPYTDSVGIGYYRIDLHPSTGGDNYLDVPALPFRIPLGALLPVRVRNLLPAAKNIGTTHITNGCYRLHPVEWNIGEVAGLLVAWCQSHRIEPAQVAEGCADFQAMLAGEGVELAWPEDLVLAEGDPHIHAMRPSQSSEGI
jgi:hypothetical protein